MNDATRKRLEAAGWKKRRLKGGWADFWCFTHPDDAKICFSIDMSLYDDAETETRPDPIHLAALRAFIEAFEEENKDHVA